MNYRRRNFLKNTVFAALPLFTPLSKAFGLQATTNTSPVVISTWQHGLEANDQAWRFLVEGRKAVDSVEAGVNVSEANPEVNSVGLGGIPDRSGVVSLDASIMDEKGNAGSVGFLQHIVQAVSVARKVMEETPHVMLAGEGALAFAVANGFEKQDLLTTKAKTLYDKWKRSGQNDHLKEDNAGHDTIGMLAQDQNGDIAGACTTSGLAWKFHGRVGDSPIIGAGLYVDNQVGGACATGKGEAAMKTCGSFLVVELMRNGLSPRAACKKAVERIAKWHGGKPSFQIGFLAMNKQGVTGAYSLNEGFKWARYQNEQNELLDADHLF